MSVQNLQKGQSLIEMLFAIAIFTVGVVTIGYLIIDALLSLRYGVDSTKARFLAAEGIEAVISMRDGGFDLIPEGTYGLLLSGGHWTLASSPDEIGKFTRSITILDINKNYKEVTSEVAWDLTSVNTKNIIYTTQLTNWRQTGGASSHFNIAIEDISFSASGTDMLGLSITNEGDEGSLITEMNIWWDGPASLLGINIGGSNVYDATITGTVLPGEDIDVTNYYLAENSGAHQIDSLVFSETVETANFIILFRLSDGSEKSVYISPE